ncbi:lycopene cyclase domain-containing protein [Microbacterium sp. R86528]|uniref:lycopene cyclase domain-containing protein n=1 Tax=Microbacterium sp. R86528 TaxID=3093864 RepID=UPI0037C57B18
MPGLYMAAILISATGIAILDARFRLALWRDAVATLAAVAVGVAFFLSWDAVGIVTGVFVKGDSPLFLGLDLAPHLPLEEVFFLTFLSYLSLVVWSATMRLLDRPAARGPQVRQGGAKSP